MNKHLISKEDLDELVYLADFFKEVAMNSYHATDLGLQEDVRALEILIKKLGYSYD